ncbi:hypothetical protein B7R54_08140 [Subtercola boreus]|uniref:Uncharacterized protein n=1 Tax=Subtercola boreus TaxID=120213 RepID=A0A3E0VHR1_9MICO|nr:hypothetical protein [Subtercola boreus]RFA09199.1 hypothetical protein B7R54_08140 [Subtercola boreus]TQL53781.1 hypothetical protein FB464_1299 [Subtercola boreus]
MTSTWQQAAPPAASLDDIAVFGAGEVAYALSLCSEEARERASRFLQVEPGFVTPQVAALGASSLIARGELTVDGDALVPSGGIRLLIGVLQNAVRFTEIAMVNEAGPEAALYVQSPELSLLLQPGSMGTWSMVVKAPEAADSALLKQVIDDNARRHPEGVAYFGTELVGTGPADAVTGNLFVRPAGVFSWDVADVRATDGESVTQERTENTSTAALLDRLADLVRLPQR